MALARQAEERLRVMLRGEPAPGYIGKKSEQVRMFAPKGPIVDAEVITESAVDIFS